MHRLILDTLTSETNTGTVERIGTDESGDPYLVKAVSPFKDFSVKIEGCIDTSEGSSAVPLPDVLEAIADRIRKHGFQVLCQPFPFKIKS